MKTKSGFETNGTYLKYKSGFTGRWCIETEKGILHFKTEAEADKYIDIITTGGDLWTNLQKEFIYECEMQLTNKYKQ